MSLPHILVVDDEPDIRIILKEILEDEGFEVTVAENAAEAREARRSRRPDLVLLDIWLPDTDGITLLKEWTEDAPLDIPVIMMSGHGTVETAVEATRLGAYDFIEKPLSHAKLLLTIRRAFESAELRRENIGLRRQAQAVPEPIGRSSALTRLREQILRIASHKTAVFIRGEPGSGKEVFARYLHGQSPRASGPFISVSVAGLAIENPGAELFGSEDDNRVHFGSLEKANGGTLLLKDIADLDLNLQARLLSALENQSFLRVGGRETVALDVRIVAATRQNLLELVKTGRFRDDLFYHLNVLPLHVAPLREHNEDVPDLLDYYANYFAVQEGLARRQFTLSAKRRLKSHEWPGNVRELKNLVQRLLILGGDEVIDVGEVDAALGGRPRAATTDHVPPGFDLPLREAREQFERAYFEYQLQHVGGSISKVAERVGIERTHLYRKLRMLGIDSKQIAADGTETG
jgi:DNA-binding NtrC family response regulator